MKKRHIFIISILGMLFSACQSDEQWEGQLPDGADLITFSAMPQQPVSRVDYISYTPDNRPTTMGVFGYADMHTINSLTSEEAVDKNKHIFDNNQLTYVSSGAKEGYWQSDKYWSDYVAYSDFTFFAYMPYTAESRLTKSGSAYTLSYPVSLTTPMVTNETALICNNPIVTTQIAQSVEPFKLDQTLTGFTFSFKLGDKMGNIRKFIVKSVKLYGEGFPTTAPNTVSRTYTYSDGNWTAGDITWTPIATQALTSETAVNIPYVNNGDGYTDESEGKGTMLVYKDKYRQWGSAHYTIPGIDFTPTIEVTYDVVVENDETHDVITRKDVVSTMILKAANFQSYTNSKTGQPGRIYNVQIQIVPRYLYVLADADQYSGILLIE